MAGPEDDRGDDDVTSRPIARSCFVVAVALALAGCGGGPKRPKTYPATGTVTLDGQPLADATVSFVPAVGPPSDGKTDASGKFVIMTSGQPGAPVGANKVTVSKFTGSATMPMAGGTPDDMKKMYEKMYDKSKKTTGDKGELPAKYGRPDTSGLSAEVTADGAKNVFTFELSSK